MSDFWVFGYGSLMWRPGFDHREAAPARLAGAHRSLCVYSWFHRGTKERPGLVLGLDRGGSCRGVAFKVAGRNRDSVLAYLRERELVTEVYHETWRPVVLLDRRKPVTALAYVVDRDHAQYAGRLAPERVLDLVRDGEGRSGGNAEYVLNTVGHLRQLGIRDAMLERIAGSLARPPSGSDRQREA